MNLNFKSLMDGETGRTLLAAIGGLGATAVAIDWLLRTIIAILTVWYLWVKIHRPKNHPHADPDDEDEI